MGQIFRADAPHRVPAKKFWVGARHGGQNLVVCPVPQQGTDELGRKLEMGGARLRGGAGTHRCHLDVADS